MTVFVVLKGERGEGDEVIGLRLRLDEAEILALLQVATYYG